MHTMLDTRMRSRYIDGIISIIYHFNFFYLSVEQFAKYRSLKNTLY